MDKTDLILGQLERTTIALEALVEKMDGNGKAAEEENIREQEEDAEIQELEADLRKQRRKKISIFLWISTGISCSITTFLWFALVIPLWPVVISIWFLVSLMLTRSKKIAEKEKKKIYNPFFWLSVTSLILFDFIVGITFKIFDWLIYEVLTHEKRFVGWVLNRVPLIGGIIPSVVTFCWHRPNYWLRSGLGAFPRQFRGFYRHKLVWWLSWWAFEQKYFKSSLPKRKATPKEEKEKRKKKVEETKEDFGPGVTLIEQIGEPEEKKD